MTVAYSVGNEKVDDLNSGYDIPVHAYLSSKSRPILGIF